MPETVELWERVGRIGYLGRRRDERHREFDEKYGVGNWELKWVARDYILNFVGLATFYEDAYLTFLNKNPDITAQLVRDACEVYDDAPSNVQSGFDYGIQETDRTHVQDIAIRNALARLGKWFQGTELIQIRHDIGKHPLSMILSPGKVPFHRPRLIETPQLSGWWDIDSVEAFYQSNRYLYVKEQM